jgi:hypothetical protein
MGYLVQAKRHLSNFTHEVKANGLHALVIAAEDGLILFASK